MRARATDCFSWFAFSPARRARTAELKNADERYGCMGHTYSAGRHTTNRAECSAPDTNEEGAKKRSRSLQTKPLDYTGGNTVESERDGVTVTATESETDL